MWLKPRQLGISSKKKISSHFVRNSKNPPGRPQTATADPARRACRAPRACRRPNPQIVWIVAMLQLGAWHD
jgi:hypothetical protein